MNELLANIAEAGLEGFVYASEEEAAPLIDEGLIEVNRSVFNDFGEIAVRITQKGLESLDKGEKAADNEVLKMVNEMFDIKKDVPMPATSSGRNRHGYVFPFAHLEVNDSFFVEGEKGISPSTISSATARYAVPSPDGLTKVNRKGESVPVMVPTRRFVGRKVVENGVAGIRVWRVA